MRTTGVVTVTPFVPELDPSDVRLARHAPGILADFNATGVLNAADVHVALRLGRLGGDEDQAVLLAAALAVRPDWATCAPTCAPSGPRPPSTSTGPSTSRPSLARPRRVAPPPLGQPAGGQRGGGDG